MVFRQKNRIAPRSKSVVVPAIRVKQKAAMGGSMTADCSMLLYSGGRASRDY
jgi:hypothetical protein